MKPSLLRLVCAIALCVFPAQTNQAAPARPNILLILADDLGWSDLGCYGGEIDTPTLDGLARGGLRFSQFYDSARCCPSRAALLTGLNPHQAGVPDMRGPLNRQCVTIPEVLKPAGYRCYMVGKWHLGPEAGPIARGFDEFYGMIHGFNSCWQEKPYYTRLPQDRPKRQYATNGFYSTDVFGDYALDFLGEANKTPDKPWFLYLAFNAPHFPLHAYEQDIAKYEKLYLQGWDSIREQRVARQKQLGLVPKEFNVPPRSSIPLNLFNGQTGWANKDNPAWDGLMDDRKRDLARRMAVYAAMVDRMDRAVGRVVAYLKQTGQIENTLIVFLSDNGACAEWDPWGFDHNSGPTNVLHTGASLKEVGGPGSYVSYGSGWANACNTPWRLYKHYGHEGGISAPCIVHWPAGLKRPGRVDERPCFLTDVMATCVEVSGATYPEKRKDHPVLPMEGKSLVPAFQNKRAQSRIICMEHEGNRAIRDGKWKLVGLRGAAWELYDIEQDRAELKDLSLRYPKKVRELSEKWEAWARRIGAKVR